ncbi:MAG TPA: hypothetical protein VKP65_13195 [Rhodothermales bacterium]|nr:hypothetical protein [Rhodothermales bacterium]
MTTHLHIGSLRRATELFLIVLAFITGTALLLGCSDEALMVADAAEDSAAPATISPMIANSNGLIVVDFPSPENPGPPLYATGFGTAAGGFGALITDGEWVAIEFVRDPDCIPDDYNLVSGLFNIPHVFGCQLTIEGRVWLRDLSNPNVPFKAEHSGLGAVPIYFVQLSEYEDAIMDGELTISEFNGLSSLQVGYASFQRDVFQFPQTGRPGTHNIVSRGELEDGRSFQFKSVNVGFENVQTTIQFE